METIESYNDLMLIKKVLTEMELYRNKANSKNDHPPSDYHIRVCQSMLAEIAGFNKRSEWCNEKCLGIEIRL